MSIYSPLGIEGGILVSGSADHEIRKWHLVKKKISNRIDVERPDEDILLRYRENSHEPLPNYAEDHILNTPKALAK
jgi:WD40 repeat protein